MFLVISIWFHLRNILPKCGRFRIQHPIYKACPESIQPFWISRELVVWPWCNFAASQTRPYCASMNSHFLVGLVSRQWNAVDWACVLHQYACPFYSSRAGFFFGGGGKTSHYLGLSDPYSPDLVPCDFWSFPKLKSLLTVRRFLNATVTQYTNSVDGVSLPTD